MVSEGRLRHPEMLTVRASLQMRMREKWKFKHKVRELMQNKQTKRTGNQARSIAEEIWIETRSQKTFCRKVGLQARRHKTSFRRKKKGGGTQTRSQRMSCINKKVEIETRRQKMSWKKKEVPGNSSTTDVLQTSGKYLAKIILRRLKGVERVNHIHSHQWKESYPAQSPTAEADARLR